MNNERLYLSTDRSFFSIQGEGMSLGKPSVFLRMAGCNLNCNWGSSRCDTLEVWSNGTMVDYEDVIPLELIEYLHRGARLIVTGGEPMIRQSSILHYLTWLEETHSCIPFVEIETNGSITPTEDFLWRVNQWNCSPKTLNSNNPDDIRFNKNALETINKEENSHFKFVITCKEDIDEIQTDYAFLDHDKIWLMPACADRKQQSEFSAMVAELAKENMYCMTTRAQITIWDKVTGV